MNFIKDMLNKNGVGAVEAISTLSSGNSLADAGKNLARRAMSKKFEGMFIQAADAYTSGYSSINMAMLGAAGISAGVGATTWGAMKGISYLNDLKDEEDQSHNVKLVGMVASFAAFIFIAISFIVINNVRRQKMFTALAGENMATQYVKFFTIPLVLFFVLLRVMIPSESADSSQLFLMASGLAGAFLLLVKKFYFVYKINLLEKNVFETIASAFEACKGAGSGSCDHEHAGFVDVFNNVNSVLQENVRMVFGEVDYADIARELSKSQKFDTISSLTS